MSLSASNAEIFFAEVTEGGSVWAIRDLAGFPTSTSASGEIAMPFWSKKSRAEKIIEGVKAYSNFEPFELSLAEFIENWLPGLEGDGLFVGLNWYGKRATGYNSSPADVCERLIRANPSGQK